MEPPLESAAFAVFAAMATPSALLLANAMLILSTIQRLQAVLERIRESEETLRCAGSSAPAAAALAELVAHGRRARLAHRALLALYAAATLLLLMIGALGSSALGLPLSRGLALAGAFGGAGLLLLAAALLAAETWVGVGAIDRRIHRLVREFDARQPEHAADGIEAARFTPSRIARGQGAGRG